MNRMKKFNLLQYKIPEKVFLLLLLIFLSILFQTGFLLPFLHFFLY